MGGPNRLPSSTGFEMNVSENRFYRDPLERAVERAHVEAIVRNSVRQGREGAIDAAIKICEAVVSQGGDAVDCLNRLRQFQHEMNRDVSR